jgi:hypothetical protein
MKTLSKYVQRDVCPHHCLSVMYAVWRIILIYEPVDHIELGSCGVNWAKLAQVEGPVEGYCEYNNTHSAYIQFWGKC